MTFYKNLTAAIILAAGLLPASGAWAQADPEESRGPRAGLSVGGRAVYYRSKGAGSGEFSQGAQARYQLTRRWALELSADLRQESFPEAKVDVIPIQLSVIAYLMPHGYRLAPYILAGGGWYYTHVYAPADRTDFRFGPHAGGGVEYFLNTVWSFGGSYRYLWTEDIHSQDLAHPLGRNITDKGYMLTAAVNYSF